MMWCSRYRKLLDRMRDGEISARLEKSMVRHEDKCGSCAEFKQADEGLDFLAGIAFGQDFETRPQFAESVAMATQVDRQREKISFWIPAFVGAGVAAVAVVVMLQLLSQAGITPISNSPIGEARRFEPAGTPSFPVLDLRPPSSRNR